MLVLSRKPGERILIGDDITVTIVRIGPNNVRLGIDAPKEVPVHRQEVYDAIRRDMAVSEQADADASGSKSEA